MSRTYEALKLAGQGLSQNQTLTNLMPRLDGTFENRLLECVQNLAMVETNILGAGKDTKTLYVTSSLNGEGKTTAAIELAYGLTTNRSAEVLLIDGNPRFPKLHTMFNTTIGPGLTDFFYTDALINDVVRATAYSKLSLMTFGSAAVERTNLFSEDRHLEKLSALKERYGFIVFDGNSVMETSETSLIARYFEGVVIVVECEQTKWEVVQLVQNKLKSVGAKPMGIVMNRRKFYIPRFFYDRS